MTFKQRVIAAFKRYFLAGILIIAPIAATLWVLLWLVKFIMRKVTVGLLPEHYDLGPDMPGIIQNAFNSVLKAMNFGIGTILALTIILLVGGLARNYLGRRVLRWWESIIEQIPFLRSLYSAIKQLMETLFLSTTKQFSQAVVIEWPRKGLYSIAFVTRDTQAEFLESVDGLDRKMVNVFIPSTPNPTTGYFVIVPEDDIREIPLSPEQAFKVIISGGIASPTDLHLNNKED